MAPGICPFATFIPGVTSFSAGHVDRVGFCDHAAAGFMGTLKNPSFWNGVGTSVHFAISRTGEVAQLVNIFDTAFAQGRLGPSVTWSRFGAMNGGNPNGYLISTEHEDEAVLNASWTDAMYESDLRVKRWCIEECKSQNLDVLRFGIDSLCGHFMFDGVDRVNCPGSGWPRDRLFADLTHSPGAVSASSPAPGQVYHQHDGWGLEGVAIGGGERATVNARQQFGVPAEATRLSIEWLPRTGYGVVLHGNTKAQAGRFGWARLPEVADGYSHTPNVELDAAGNFEILAEDVSNPVELLTAHVTAWW